MTIDEQNDILELNPNDASFDARQIPKTKNTIKRGLAGLLAAISLFSGSVLGATKVEAAQMNDTQAVTEMASVSPNTVIDIPESYQYEVYDLCGKELGDTITVGDLNDANSSFVSISVSDNQSLEWLNYLNNVETLAIAIHTDDMSAFKDVKKIPGLKSLSLFTLDPADLTKENFSFLKNSKDLSSLDVHGFNVEPGVLEELSNLSELRLTTAPDYGSSEVDYSKLTFLNELTFPINEPYDVAMNLTSEDYQKLKKAGVEITFEDEASLATLLNINEKLDGIVNSLGVTKDSSDQEKLDAILVYVLDNLEYDEAVSQMLQANVDDTELTSSFYQGGALYGALEKDTAICGNYAALTKALLNRLDVNNYYLSSIDHAWNLVEVEGDYYYVDPTWLDSQSIAETYTEAGITEDGQRYESTTFTSVPATEAIKEGRATELDWYMEDPTDYPASYEQNESHKVEHLPSYIKIKPLKDKDKDKAEVTPEAEKEQVTEEKVSVKEENEKTDETKEPVKITQDDKFEILAGNKKWIVGGAVAIGLMAGLGGAVAVSNKKKAEKRRRQRQAQNLDLNPPGFDDFFSNDPYGNNDYSTDFSHSSRRK